MPTVLGLYDLQVLSSYIRLTCLQYLSVLHIFVYSNIVLIFCFQPFLFDFIYFYFFSIFSNDFSFFLNNFLVINFDEKNEWIKIYSFFLWILITISFIYTPCHLFNLYFCYSFFIPKFSFIFFVYIFFLTLNFFIAFYWVKIYLFILSHVLFITNIFLIFHCGYIVSYLFFFYSFNLTFKFTFICLLFGYSSTFNN